MQHQRYPSFKARYIIFYLGAWLLMYGCTATWVWVMGSDDAKIQVESTVDSISADYGLFGGQSLGRKNDTLVVKEIVTDTVK